MSGTVHVALAITSLVLGALVFFQKKGGRRHRLLGYLYAGALLLVNVSALLVYDELSGPGPFHVLAVVSLVTLSAGFVPALLRRPEGAWLGLHAYFMSWSYVGLVAAGVAQVATKLVGPGVLPVLLPSIVTVLAGALLIHSRVPEILSGLARGKVRPDGPLHEAQPN